MRARQWVPEMGSFLTIDEYSEHDPTTTLWGWPSQNPLRYSDPTGRSGVAVAVVVAVAVAAVLVLSFGLDVPSDTKEAPADVFGAALDVTGMGALSCPLRVGGKVAGRSLVRSVAMSGGVDIQPATKFRLIQRGEKVMDIANEINELSKTTDLEYAVVRTESNERMIIYGGREGINFEGFPLKTLIGHSHPPGVQNALSAADIALTHDLGQRSGWLLEDGRLQRFWVSDYPHLLAK